MRNSLEVKTKLGSFGFFRSWGISLIRELDEPGSANESGTTRLTYCAQRSVAADHARSSTDTTPALREGGGFPQPLPLAVEE
jgi:hypothetical protein